MDLFGTAPKPQVVDPSLELLIYDPQGLPRFDAFAYNDALPDEDRRKGSAHYFGMLSDRSVQIAIWARVQEFKIMDLIDLALDGSIDPELNDRYDDKEVFRLILDGKLTSERWDAGEFQNLSYVIGDVISGAFDRLYAAKEGGINTENGLFNFVLHFNKLSEYRADERQAKRIDFQQILSNVRQNWEPRDW